MQEELAVGSEKVTGVRPTFLGYTVDLDFAAGFSAFYQVISDNALILQYIVREDLNYFRKHGRKMAYHVMQPFSMDLYYFM